MSEPHLDSQAVLADLKDFQRRTALWTYERMFTERDPAVRFLVADEVGLGKTHVAKGVIALVIEHLRRIGDERPEAVPKAIPVANLPPTNRRRIGEEQAPFVTGANEPQKDPGISN